MNEELNRQNAAPGMQGGPTVIHETKVVVVGEKKSMILALVLTFFFGPLGLFYASTVGGIIMCIITVIVGLLTFLFGAVGTWPVCMAWAAYAVYKRNKAIDDAAGGRVPV